MIAKCRQTKRFMGAESNSKNANITIISNNLPDQDAYKQLVKSGYLVKEIRFDGEMIEVADLIILGRDIANQLSAQSENQRDQDLSAILSNNPDTPIIYLHKYGELSGLQASIFLQDISDRLQHSQRIKELKSQNLELSTQLQKAKDISEVEIKSKVEFLTRISHELRIPLNAILGFSQLLSWDNLLTMEQRGYTEIIYDSGKQLLSLVNDILEMSKIESHRQEVDKKVFVLREMINDLKHIFTSKAEKKKLELVLKIAEEVPICVQSDEIKLRQILVNILNNAIKETQTGSITLNTFICSDILTEQLHLVFEIEDTGAGITHLEIDSVFEPFVESGFKSEEGTGLGLSISKHFARLLGGELKVSSELGEGTTFTLSIPMEIPKNLANFSGDRFTKIENQKPESSLSILLAEDSFVDQKVLVRILNQMGYSVDVASDGVKVLAALETKFYDIVLMDVQMPNMDGIETTRQIIEKFGIENSPVIIALTAGALPEDRKRCMKVGMHDFMTKPIRPKQLKAVLDHWQQKLEQV